ncbi:MAG TPA: TMEM175 family protein [Pyrinomonadaceae bacterium]
MRCSEEAIAEKETGRVEAFSDGVFAIAITLLVLDLKVPRLNDQAEGGLWRALAMQWPTYLAFVTSFLTILVMWINHHRLFGQIKKSDHLFLILNGLLLMGITVVPFPTSLLADYIESNEARIAAMIYSGTFVLIAIFFNLLWRYASGKGGRLLAKDHDAATVLGITEQYRFGPLMYAAIVVVAYFSAIISFMLCLLLAVFFAIPKSAKPRELNRI